MVHKFIFQSQLVDELVSWDVHMTFDAQPFFKISLIRCNESEVTKSFHRKLFSRNTGMAPPSYADLGKQARDVFNKGYNFGVWKLDCRTKTDNGVEFSTAGHSNQETGKVFGSLETKYKVPEYGLTFSEKWNTDNTLYTDVTHSDKLVKGLKLTFEGSFAPQSGNKNGKVRASYGQDLVQVNSDVNLDLAGPIVNASAVVGWEGWLAGYQTAFDTQKGKLVTNNFALGYTNKDIAVTTNV